MASIAEINRASLFPSRDNLAAKPTKKVRFADQDSLVSYDAKEPTKNLTHKIPERQFTDLSCQALFINVYKIGYERICCSTPKSSQKTKSHNDSFGKKLFTVLTGVLLLIPVVNTLVYLAFHFFQDKKTGSQKSILKNGSSETSQTEESVSASTRSTRKPVIHHFRDGTQLIDATKNKIAKVALTNFVSLADLIVAARNPQPPSRTEEHITLKGRRVLFTNDRNLHLAFGKAYGTLAVEVHDHPNRGGWVRITEHESKNGKTSLKTWLVDTNKVFIQAGPRLPSGITLGALDVYVSEDVIPTIRDDGYLVRAMRA